MKPLTESGPWERRVAHLLRLSATSIPDGFGQVVIGVFHLLGVTGMDPLPNPPKNLRQIDNRHVPPSVGREVGRKAMGWAMKKLKDKERAEEFLISFMGSLIDKAKRGMLRFEGKSFDEAGRLITTMMQNYRLDQLRKEVRRPQDEVSLVDPSESVGLPGGSGDYSQVEMAQAVERAVDRATRKILRALPDSGFTEEDVEKYIELASKGYSDTQIIGQKMLPFLQDRASFSLPAWARYKKIIEESLRGQLRMASMMTEDIVVASDVTRSVTASLAMALGVQAKDEDPS